MWSTWKYLSTFIISAINIDLQNKLSKHVNNLALTAFPGFNRYTVKDFPHNCANVMRNSKFQREVLA